MTSSVKKRVLLFSFLFFFSLFILLFPDTSSAEETIYYTTECDEPVNIGSCSSLNSHTSYKECSCSGSWREYRTRTSEECGPVIETRECQSVCSGPASAYCTCCGCEAVCTNWKVCENCASWQKAERSCEVTKAGLQKPDCKCQGECIIDVPKNPRYYDNPNYPTNLCQPEESRGPNNIYLPVKLDWDDIKGWKDGWREGNICPKTCSEDCPDCPGSTECYKKAGCIQFYEIEIRGEMRHPEALRKIYVLEEKIEEEMYKEEPDFQKIKDCQAEIERIEKQELKITEYREFLDKSEFIPASCLLKSNRTYQWRVRACCEAKAGSCGDWSSWWQFTTNPAPELIEPEDPDWAGPEQKEGLPLDVTLRWCVSDFKYPEYKKSFSYRVRLYQIVNQREICHPELEAKGKCDPKVVAPVPPGAHIYPPPRFSNEKFKFFTKKTPYTWQVAACKDKRGNDCTEYSQRWRFSITSTLGKPNLQLPPNDPEGKVPVGFPVVLKWEGPLGAKSWIVQVSTKSPIKTPDPTISFNYGELSLDTLYNWKVQPCWDYNSKDCENIWSDTHWFRTTGRPPRPETMKPEGVDIPIPVIFEWENVPGAKSYRIKIRGGLNLEEVVDEKATFSLDYPKVRQLTNYSWQVATCALKNGKGCGKWSKPKSFKTFKLGMPTNPSPKDEEEIFIYQMPKTFSWDSVPYARYYRYVINYIEKSPEETGECPAGKIIEKIVQNNSDLVSLNCLGKYQWQVQACLDENCEEVGDWSNSWPFTLSQKVTPGKGGLVPCGRTYDDPHTSWNEREPCQIKHLFLMIKIILDFLLWRVGLIILVLLVIATAIIYYFSMGAPGIIIDVKSIWKSAGIGYGIIFLAWIIINLFLLILGYKIEVFGRWWEIKF